MQPVDSPQYRNNRSKTSLSNLSGLVSGQEAGVDPLSQQITPESPPLNLYYTMRSCVVRPRTVRRPMPSATTAVKRVTTLATALNRRARVERTTVVAKVVVVTPRRKGVVAVEAPHLLLHQSLENPRSGPSMVSRSIGARSVNVGPSVMALTATKQRKNSVKSSHRPMP